MKTKSLILFTLISLIGYSQDAKVHGVNTFSLRNSGTILDKNKDVDGYYFFYKVDKLKKGDVEFAIKILDKNLVEVAQKSYIDNKNTFLMKSSFNNQAMMFAMANYKEKKIELLTFDKQVNQKETVTIPLESKEIKYMQLMQQQSSDFNVLFPVDNKGFLLNKFEDNKRIGYSLKFYPTDGGNKWEFNSPEDTKEILTINPIQVNEKVVVALETSRNSAMSRKMTIRTKVIDVNTGNLLFEREYSKAAKPRLITNAFLDNDNNVVLMGEYFKNGDNILDDKSLGLFSEIIDLKGKTLSETFTSWNEDVAKLIKVNKSFINEKGYIYFHNIVRTNSGEYYAIGEFYKKTASAAGIGMAILNQGQSSVTQISITNAVIFKFNKDFKLTEITEFEKSISRAPSLTDFGSPQLNAHGLKAYGAFDYEYTQIDKANDRFYACFIDYEKIKGARNKNAFKTIIYDEGKLSEDKIYLEEGDSDFRVFPAKLGSVLLIEYNKKQKQINLHLEKLNIK